MSRSWTIAASLSRSLSNLPNSWQLLSSIAEGQRGPRSAHTSNPHKKADFYHHFNFRSFSNQLPSAPRGDIFNDIVSHTHILKLREALEDEAENSLFVPYERFVMLCKESNAAHDDAQADELCTHLHKSGVVLRAGDIVYLQPEVIAEMVLQVLPKGQEDSKQKLAVVEAELAVLDSQYQKLEESAHVGANRILYIGWVILGVQLAAFTWLTWFELSWDVMEPFGYVIGLFYTFVAYTYFMVTKGQVFDLEPFKEFWAGRLKEKSKQKCHFNEARYQHLLRLRERHLKQISAAP